MNKLKGILVMSFLLTFALFSTNAVAQVSSKGKTKTYAKDNVKETDVKSNKKKAKSFRSRFKSNRPKPQAKKQASTVKTEGNQQKERAQEEGQEMTEQRKMEMKQKEQEYKEMLSNPEGIERAKKELAQQQERGTITEKEIAKKKNLIKQAEKNLRPTNQKAPKKRRN